MSDNWKEKAACRGVPTSVFYPPEYDEKQGAWKLETALSYCNTCKVKKNVLMLQFLGIMVWSRKVCGVVYCLTNERA